MMEIDVEISGTNGRYFHRFEDGSEAKLIFEQHDDLMVIEHVGVPVQHRSNGLAAQLVKRAVEDARQNQSKVRPVCTYAAAQFRRHPEWADLLQ